MERVRVVPERADEPCPHCLQRYDEMARELDIAGRSGMTRNELIRAIRRGA